MPPTQYTAEWQALEAVQGGRSRLQGTAEELHAQFNGLIEALAPSMPAPDDSVKKEEIMCDGVRVLKFTPPGSGKRPVGIFAHSGGYVLGSPEVEALLCEVVAKNCNVVILSVDYGLSPEHKHPKAINDCMTVYKWAYAHAAELDGDTSKYFSMGGSAGGSLALSMANAIVKNESVRDHIKGCVAIVPATIHPDNVPAEYKSEYNAYTDNADAPVINDQSMRDFFSISGADPNDAANFAALNADNHKNFPKTYLAVCEGDPLRDDAFIMEKMLKKAGVPTKLDFYKGLPHYFWLMPGIPESQTFMMNLCAGVGFVLS